MTEKEENKSGFAVASFTLNATVYRFKEPLPLKHERIEGGLCLSNDELLLYATGESWHECMNGIMEELAFLWENYVMSDEPMTEGAIALKNKLRAMVV